MGKFYRLNQNITAQQVRLIDKFGKQIGILSLDDALRRARDANLDLVEIAKQANPPVVKIVDFKKFKYIEAKKEREAKRKTKEIETKEIWLSPNISDHDLNIRLEKAKNFLKSGDRVKLTVRFAGRQIAHPELAHKIINKSMEIISEIGEKDGEPKMVGRALSLNVKPIKKQ